MRRLLVPDTEPGRVTVIESSRDARMRSRFSKAGDFVRLASVDAVREMMVWGREYVLGGGLEAARRTVHSTRCSSGSARPATAMWLIDDSSSSSTS